MANPRLEVSIGADIKDLQRGLKAAESTLSGFGKATEGTDGVLSSLDSRLRVIQGNAELFGNTIQRDVAKITAYRQAINTLLSRGVSPTAPAVLRLADNVENLSAKMQGEAAKSAGTLTQAMGGVQRSMGQGQSAAISFNRVIQDAPFGIMGVSNNITQLAEQFVYLKQSTGSGSAAFKAALGSLFSPMNLVVLGISAVTSAMMFFQMRSRSATKEVKDFADSLKGLSKSTLEGEKDAQKQLVTLEVLYTKTQDVTRSVRDRNKAVDALQKLYPSYFGNLSNEAVLAGNASAVYDKLRNSILLVAQARAAEELLISNRKRELEIAREIAEVTANNAKLKESAAAIDARSAQGQAGVLLGAGIQQAKLTSSLSEGVEKAAALGKEYSSINSQNKELIADVLKLPDGLEATLKPLEEIKVKARKSWMELYKLQGEMAMKMGKRYVAPPIPTLPYAQTELEIGKINITGVMTEAELAAENLATLFNDTFGRIVLGEDTTEQMAKKMEAVRDLMANSLGGIASGIGEAIASGGNVIEAFGKGVIDAFGKFLTNFGKKLVDYGLAAGAFAKLQLAMLNPVTAIPAAGLAIAAGLALMVAGAAATSAASGGIGGQATSTQNFTTGTVVDTPQFRSEADRKGEFVLRNGDLVAAVDYGLKMRGY